MNIHRKLEKNRLWNLWESADSEIQTKVAQLLKQKYMKYSYLKSTKKGVVVFFLTVITFIIEGIKAGVFADLTSITIGSAITGVLMFIYDWLKHKIGVNLI